jgi:hypothetical protein
MHTHVVQTRSPIMKGTLAVVVLAAAIPVAASKITGKSARAHVAIESSTQAAAIP